MDPPLPGPPDPAPEAPPSGDAGVAEPEAGLLEAGAAAARRSRQARRRGVAGLAGVGLLGVVAGAVAATAAIPGLRARAEGLPAIRTVTQPTADTASPAAAAYRILGPSVVLVENQQAAQPSFFSGPAATDWGSGVIMSSSGYIVTNDHVVENASQITVTLADGSAYPATLVGGDPSTDLAVIRINPREALQPATFANSSAVQVGETAIAIGNPLGPEYQESVDQGIVSAVRPMLYGLDSQQERVTTMIQTDAPVNPGNSGGPLANAQGQVIGIVSEKTVSTGEAGVQAVGLGFAIPSDTVAQVANELVRYGYYKWPWLGITFSSQLSQTLPNEKQTLIIASVVSGGPSSGKLQAGDVITSWNGRPVNNYDDLVADITASQPGQTVDIGVERGGHGVTVAVTLGTEPESEALGQGSAAAQPAGGGGASGGFPGIVIPGPGGVGNG